MKEDETVAKRGEVEQVSPCCWSESFANMKAPVFKKVLEVVESALMTVKVPV